MKKYQIYTTPQQSERLVDCGVDTNTADFAYHVDTKDTFQHDWNTGSYGHTIPVWSLSALIGLLPETITRGKETYYLDFAPYDGKGWGIGYFSTEGIRSIKGLTRPADPIETCVCAIEWVTRNDYKLKD